MAIEEPKGLKGLKGLNRVNEYNNLPFEEKRAFIDEQIAAGRLPIRYTDDQAARLYKNKQFINEFGEDLFDKAVANGITPEQRDQLFREKVVKDTAKEYYGNDKGFNNLSQTLTTDGWEDLMRSGYLNDEDREAKKGSVFKGITPEEIKDFMDMKKDKNTFDYLYKMKGRSMISDEQKKIDKEQEEIKNKVITADDKRIKASAKKDVDIMQKHFNVMADNISKAQQMEKDVMDNKMSVDELVDFMAQSGIISNNTRMSLYNMYTEDGTQDIVGQLNTIGSILNSSPYNPDKYEELYKSIALPSERTYTDEFGNERTVKVPGSNTYKILNGSSKLQNFGPSDMLREYLTYSAIANKHGLAKASSVLETDMQHIADDNETTLDWAEDVILNIGIGGLANIMNKANGINNLLVMTVYGKEGLSNKLQGKNPDGTERTGQEDMTPYINAVYGDSQVGKWMQSLYDNYKEGGLSWFYDNAFNPQYWEKADHYNTLDPEWMKKIDEAGGISPFTNMHPVDEPLEFWSTRTLAEALKMMKFVWSDMLVAEATGGVGSIASATLGKTAATVADIATILTSGVGIAESYAMSTYDQVYQQASENSRDARIDRALYEINKDIEDNGFSKEEMAMINAITENRYNEQQDRKASDALFIGLSKDQIKERVIEDYKHSLVDSWLKDNKQLEIDDEKVARNAAVNAYIINATIEEIRMSVINAGFRRYLFDKGTLNRLGLNKEYANTIRGNSGKHSLPREALYKAYGPAKIIFSGFESNYFDDVTVGFAKGFALGQDNDYLARKYDPENEGKATDFTLSFAPGWKNALVTAQEALLDKQSWYDGTIGALGTVFNVTPNARIKQRMREMNVTEESKLNALQKLNLYITNPLLQAYYEQSGKYQRTSALLDGANKVINDHADELRTIGNIVNGMDKVHKSTLTPGIDRAMNAKDTKEDAAFSLIYALEASQESPLINQNPLVKSAFNTIDRLASGRITQEDVDAFLNTKENQVITDNNSREEATKIAKERIQKNAQELQKMVERIQVVNEFLKETDADNALYNQKDYADYRQQLAYVLSKTDLAQDRANELEKGISGKELFRGKSFIDKVTSIFKKSDYDNSHIARYGNLENAKDALTARLKTFDIIKNEIEKAQLKHEHNVAMYEQELKNNPTSQNLNILRDAMLISELSLKRKEADYAEAFMEVNWAKADVDNFSLGGENTVLTEEQILNLNPVDRWNMLKAENRKNYSKEQQDIIKETINNLHAKDNQALSKVKNVSDLVTRVNENNKAYRLLSDPSNKEMAFAYVNSLRERNESNKYIVTHLRRARTVLSGLDKLDTKEAQQAYIKAQLESSNGQYINEYTLQAYADAHPEKAGMLSDIIKGLHNQRLVSNAIDNIMTDNPKANTAWKKAFASYVNGIFNKADFESALQDVIDRQNTQEAANIAKQIVDEYYKLASNEKVTKSRKTLKREKLRKEREEKALQQAKLNRQRDNAINKVKDTYKLTVGDEVVDGESTGTVVDIIADPITESGEIKGFTPEVSVKYVNADGTSSIIRYNETTKPISDLKKVADIEKAKKEATAKSISEFKAVSSESTVDSAQKFDRGEISAQEFLNQVGFNATDVLNNNTATSEQILDLANRVKKELLVNNKKAETSQETKEAEAKAEEVKKEETKEKPKEKSSEETPTQTSIFDDAELVPGTLRDVSLGEDGNVISPSVEQQAKQSGVLAVEVKEDDTDQGNLLKPSDDVLSGNRFVEYSLVDLIQGIVRQEVPNASTTIFGELRKFLDRFGEIKLQEIIDKEFQKILLDNPNVEIRFLKPNYAGLKMSNTLDKILLNVIEFTPKIAKYHDNSRGGVFEANGRRWLLVGTSGFERGDLTGENKQKIDVFNAMQRGIRERARQYYSKYPEAQFYVDNAHTRVRNTTSGRIVNVPLGENSRSLIKVSELLKRAGKQLYSGMFGIQTKQATESKKFAVTFNAKALQEQGKVYSPRNVQDNAGRTFILIDTPNGNKIPGMIERTYFNNLDTDSQLYGVISTELGKLLSKNSAVREDAIASLCGLLVLTDTDNILVSKDSKYNKITIRRNGFSDIVFDLNGEVNIIDFMNAIKEANFLVNVPLGVLNDANMLKMYDDAGALMTSVASMETVGSGYDIYVTDENGNPIIKTPATVGNPGTGDSNYTPGTISFVVNNTVYTKRVDGKYMDRNDNIVDPESELGRSLYYNELIKDSAPIFYNRRQYYVLEDKDGRYLLEKDSLNNIKRLSKEESDRLLSDITDVVNENLRKNATLESLKDVDLGEEAPQPKPMEESVVESLEKDFIGEETKETSTEKPNEEKVNPSPKPKEGIVGINNVAKENLQNSDKLDTFEKILNNHKYTMSLFSLLKSKGWGISPKTSIPHIMEILKSKGIALTGIKNIEDWMNLIRDCK